MKLDPLTISITALGVSVFSLILTAYRGNVDRKIQWEQLRGSVYARLTSRGVELLTMIEELRRFQTDESNGLIQKLIDINQGIIDIRKTLKEMESLPPFSTSAFLVKFNPIKSNLDDADVIFDQLRAAIGSTNIDKADKIATGLVQRFYGNSVRKD